MYKSESTLDHHHFHKIARTKLDNLVILSRVNSIPFAVIVIRPNTERDIIIIDSSNNRYRIAVEKLISVYVCLALAQKSSSRVFDFCVYDLKFTSDCVKMVEILTARLRLYRPVYRHLFVSLPMNKTSSLKARREHASKVLGMFK